jgi:uncharacterized RDD family membrane protein YckC
VSDPGDWQPPLPPGPAPAEYPPPPPVAAPRPEQPLAGWWARVGATLLDTVFVFVLTGGGITLGAVLAEATSDLVLIPFIAVGVGALLLYAPLLMRREGPRNGQTWGKQIAGIRVVRDGDPPMTLGPAFVREFLVKTLLFGWIGGSIVIGWLLDVLWPLWDAKNQALHDMIVATRVVKA